ncbi:MAG: hypothetical protein ACLT4C_05485 [Butyricicoccus sp.]
MLNVLIVTSFPHWRPALSWSRSPRCEEERPWCDASKQLYLVVTVIALIISALACCSAHRCCACCSARSRTTSCRARSPT